jgi:formamidopyrimidine-DNA glycosylase
MPELPEVETIARDLRRGLVGLTIKDFKVVNERTRRARPFLNLGENEFRRALVGRIVKQINRRAKMLIFELSGDKYLLAHLKMTGQLILKRPRGRLVVGGHQITGVGLALPNKFTRAQLGFSDGSRLYFNDIRRFGWLKIFDKTGLDKELSSLGPEPLEKKFTVVSLGEILRRKARTTVKQAIMDQKQLVGVGNIYADESLFAARIKPQRLAGSLKGMEIDRLHRAIGEILKLSIANRGTSFSDYRDGHGHQGNFVKLLKVYGRAGEPCPVCGRQIKKMTLGGRGTHWCAHCQR